MVSASFIGYELCQIICLALNLQSKSYEIVACKKNNNNTDGNLHA